MQIKFNNYLVPEIFHDQYNEKGKGEKNANYTNLPLIHKVSFVANKDNDDITAPLSANFLDPL